jgi:hypothetical protein
MKTICKGFALLFKTILLVLLVAILTPILYFTWRAARPMELTQFNGLTYQQFTAWRVMSCKKYLADSKENEANCTVVRHVAADLYATNIAAILIWIEKPELFKYVTPYNFFPAMWSMFESLTWSTNTSESGTMQFFGQVPTPEEFESLKLEHQLSAVQ